MTDISRSVYSVEEEKEGMKKEDILLYLFLFVKALVFVSVIFVMCFIALFFSGDTAGLQKFMATIGVPFITDVERLYETWKIVKNFLNIFLGALFMIAMILYYITKDTKFLAKTLKFTFIMGILIQISRFVGVTFSDIFAIIFAV